jgi:hypothetical protein
MRKYLRAIASANMNLLGIQHPNKKQAINPGKQNAWMRFRNRSYLVTRRSLFGAGWRNLCTPKATRLSMKNAMERERKNDEKRKAGLFKTIVRKPA